ncbi:MAG: TolC family protein [Bacteroidota bacterium]
MFKINFNPVLSKGHGNGLKPGLLLLFALLAGFTSVKAQRAPVQIMTLHDCLAYGAENSKRVEVSKMDVDYTTEQKNEILGTALPQISGTSQFDDNLKLQSTLLPSVIFGGPKGEYTAVKFGQKYNFNSTINATLDIYNPGIWMGLKANRTNRLNAETKLVQVKEDVAYNIASAYYKAVISNYQITLLKDNITKTESLLKNSELELKNGTSRKVDVDRIRVNRNNLNYQLVQANINRDLAIVRLKNAMGMNMDKEMQPAETGLDLPEAAPVKQNNFADYSNRVDYRVNQINVELAVLARQNNNTGYQPKLTAYGKWGTQAQRQEFNFFNGNQPWFEYRGVGATLTVPIFDGLQRSKRDKQNLIRVTQAERNLELNRQTIDMDVQTAALTFNNRLQTILSNKENMTLAESILEVSRLEYKNGVSTSQTVVDSENALQQARNNYTTALLDLYQSKLDYEKAKGNITNYLINLK